MGLESYEFVGLGCLIFEFGFEFGILVSFGSLILFLLGFWLGLCVLLICGVNCLGIFGLRKFRSKLEIFGRFGRTQEARRGKPCRPCRGTIVTVSVGIRFQAGSSRRGT